MIVSDISSPCTAMLQFNFQAKLIFPNIAKSTGCFWQKVIKDILVNGWLFWIIRRKRVIINFSLQQIHDDLGFILWSYG